MRNGSSTLGGAEKPPRRLRGVTAHQDLLVLLEDPASQETKVPLGCLDVWGPQEMPGCPSSGPEAPLASRAPEGFPDFRVPLGWTANRATPDPKERWAWRVPEDSRDPKEKKEKRVSVESTRTGST